MKKILGLVFFLSLDIITKAWALLLGTGTAFPSETMLENPIFLKQLTGFFNFILVRNTGVSFSMFSNFSSQLPLIIFTTLIIGWLFHWLFKEKNKLNQWVVVLITAGALGNLIDRIRFNGVIDFIDWHYAGFHWPTFNIADVCISLGVGVYLVGWLIQKRLEKTK